MRVPPLSSVGMLMCAKHIVRLTCCLNVWQYEYVAEDYIDEQLCGSSSALKQGMPFMRQPCAWLCSQVIIGFLACAVQIKDVQCSSSSIARPRMHSHAQDCRFNTGLATCVCLAGVCTVACGSSPPSADDLGINRQGPLSLQDKRARALLEQPCFEDGESMRRAVAALLTHVSPAEEVLLIGKQLLLPAPGTCWCLPSPACVPSFLRLAGLKPALPLLVVRRNDAHD